MNSKIEITISLTIAMFLTALSFGKFALVVPGEYRLIAALGIYVSVVLIMFAIITIIIKANDNYPINVVLVSILCSGILILIVISFYEDGVEDSQTKTTVIAHLVLFALIAWVYRAIFKGKNESPEVTIDTSALPTIANVYHGRCKVGPNGPIIDDPSTEDLLGRDAIINTISELIEENKSSKSIVIGIDGKWGTGKSTVINNALAKLNTNKYIKIQFNPWKYDKEESIVNELLMEINRKVLNTDTGNYKLTSKLVSDMFGVDRYNIIKDIFKLYEDKPYESYENKINSVLNENNRLIICINDFDRVEFSKVDILLRLIPKILNIKYTTIILEYDATIVNKAAKALFHAENYLDKFINVHFTIPKLNNTRIEDIANKCIQQMEIKDTQINTDDLVIDGQFINVRQLIMLLNQLYVFFKVRSKFLNTQDYIDLTTIKIVCPDLYQIIRDNEEKLTVKEAEDILNINDDSNINAGKERRDFVEELCNEKDYSNYQKQIKRMFLTEDERTYIDTRSIKSSDNNEENYKIISDRYFQSYFEDQSNYYSDVVEDVNAFITLINLENSNESIINSCVEKMLNRYKYNVKDNHNYLIVLLTELMRKAKEIRNNKILAVRCIFKLLKNAVDSNDMLDIAIIIHKIIQERTDFVSGIFNENYTNLENMLFFRILITELEKTRNNEIILNKMKSNYERRVKQEYKEGNLFNKNVYRRQTIQVFKMYGLDIKDFLSRVVSTENVYMYMNEIFVNRNNAFDVNDQFNPIYLDSKYVIEIVEASIARNEVQKEVKKNIKQILLENKDLVFYGFNGYEVRKQLIS